MAEFTVRVELHSADSTDYNNLHSKMESMGFTRTIEVGGVVYQLPEAEYNYLRDAEAKYVLAVAKLAARRAGQKDASIVVTKASESREIYGLKIADL